MMIEDKLDNIVRYSKNIFENSNFYDLEFLENFNLRNEKREKHHICFIREYLNDDKYFKNQMNIFEILRSDEIVEIKTKCDDFSGKYNYTVDIFFNYMMLFLVINIRNRDEYLNLKGKKNLTVKFFEHFKLKNGKLTFKLADYLKLLADYDLIIYDRLLSKDSTLNNLKHLNEAQDFINTLEIRLNILNNDILKSNVLLSKYLKKKRKYFKNKYFIESEFNKPQNNDSTKEPKDETPFIFQNNFNNVDANKTYQYFKKNLVEKKYLTEEELQEYLVMAFEKQTNPIQKFSFSKPKIEKIRTIYYTYFFDVAGKPYGEKQKYAELLGNYFNGFTTEKVMNNFADGHCTVRK